MKEVKTKVNSTLTLDCESWAVPPPTISWYKDGRVSWGLPGGLRLSVWSLSSAWNLLEKASKLQLPELAWALSRPLYFSKKPSAL